MWTLVRAPAFALGFALGFVVAACASPAPHTGAVATLPTEKPMTHTRTLASRLLALHYAGLFMTAPRGADRVLAEVSADELAALIADRDADGEARFLATELWFDGHDRPPIADLAALGELYARALAGGWAVYANPWGLPGEVGPIGGHLMRLGDAAVPALRARFDDATPVSYGGSEEATIGNSHAYRVKDVAAFYAARLAPAPYAVLATPAERDREIAKLAALLDEP